MWARPESQAEEITRLRGCLNDLVRIAALPVPSTGGDPSAVVSTLLDALVGMLPLSFSVVRLDDGEAGPSLEMARVAESLPDAAYGREIGEALKVRLGD